MTTFGVSAAQEALDEARGRARTALSAEHAAEARLLATMMLEYAAEYPAITGFGYGASWEYDDEGSYSWHIHPRSVTEAELPTKRRSFSGIEYEVTVDDLLADDIHGFSAEAWGILTGEPVEDGAEASVTVGELREAVGR